MEFLIDYYATANDVRTAAGRRAAVAAMMPLLREIRDPVVRDGYLQALVRRTGVEERVVLEAMRAPVPHDGRGAANRPGAGRFTADAVISAPDTLDTKAELKSLTLDEARLLRLLLLVPEQQERVADTLRAQGRNFPAPRRGSSWRRCSPIASSTAKRAVPAASSGCASSTRCRRSCTVWRSRSTRNAVRTRTS